MERALCNLVIGVNVWRLKHALAVFQNRHKPVDGIEQIFLCEAHPAFLVPDLGKIHTALKVGNVDLRALAERLHEQQLEQYAFSAARGAAQEDMRNVREVDRHRAGIAFPQRQHKAVRRKIAVFPFQHLRQICPCGYGIE